ncbi:MAG: hypothetical protein Q7T61_00855 [Caulobacter sp.]|nr:hypothetical protein [Caulobacter sp.]
MSGGGSPEVEIARLEQRMDNAEGDITELKTEQGKFRDEIGTVRRSLAWIMGAAAIVGAILSQLAGVMADKIK